MTEKRLWRTRGREINGHTDVVCDGLVAVVHRRQGRPEATWGLKTER